LITPDSPPQVCLGLCSGLLLTGGGDLPERFDGESTPLPRSAPGPIELPERVRRERELLLTFADAGRPVLGVCFGMQLMNLCFGGSLFEDLATRPGQTADHGGQTRAASHGLRVLPAPGFFSGWQPPARVSSSHGQAVRDVAPGFRAAAWAPDGVIEAIERDGLVGVEWHPESDASGDAIYRRFVARCRKIGSLR
jgi:putative glutamine amidotransferase